MRRSTNARLSWVLATLVALGVADGAYAGGPPQLVDPRGDTTVEPVPGSESVDLLGVRVDGLRERRRLSGLRVRMDLAGPALDNAATAYRVELFVGGCTLLLSAYDGRAQLLRDCGDEPVSATVRLHGTSVTWDVPLAALGTARAGDLVTGLAARVVLTEGHDRYDASVLDSGRTDTAARL